MGKISDAPEGVKPYLWHGLDAQVRGTMKNATADCPVCGREGKMGIQVHSSLFRCNACNWSGNGTEFLRWLIETSLKRTKQPAYEALAKSRGLLRWDTLPRWGVCRSALLPDRWLVPAYSPDGEVRQVYSYLRDPKTNRHRLIGTPTFSHGLCIAGQALETKRQDVVVCEGPWDGMAYDEALRLNSDTETTVVAVPGCNVFPDSWAPLFADKRVWLLYDSDRPRHLCNECGRYMEGYTEGSECSHCKTVVPPQQVAPAGLGGMQNAARVLARAVPQPAAVYYLDWGPDGYDPDKPAGYDVRDYLRQSNVIQDRGRLAGELRVRSQMVPEEWIIGLSPGAPKAAAVGMLPTFCDSWPEIIKAWRKALKWTVGLDTALSVMLASVVSTKAVGDQLWVKVVGPASCGKSTLCEALSVSRKYVKAVSTIRGFHSGYITDREGAVDNSLVAQLGDKTLIIKDGDTLMKSPNVEQILSEARDIYDRVSRTSYRNAVNREYHINMTMIICGTSSIRAMDQSELGERFVDCVIMDDIDDELEDEILLRVVHKASRNMSFEANGKMETQYEPELAKAMQLTGGYVEYLRENAHKLLQRVKAEEADLRQCHRMAKLVSFMRARPSLKQDEAAEREASFRLAGQMVRLATSLAAVLGKTTLDEDVMNRTRKVALDTARGRTLELARHLYREREAGTYVSNLAAWTGETEVKTRMLLKFLRRIGAVDSFAPQRLRGNTVRARWRLTARMERLYREVVLANEAGA